jgi:hypothetical protein
MSTPTGCQATADTMGRNGQPSLDESLPVQGQI